MTLGTKPLTRKPGEFRARCQLGVIVKEHLATPAQVAEAKRLGLQRRHLGRNSRGKDLFGWSFPTHADVFETTDRAAYQAHLDEFHNGGAWKLAGPWLKVPAKLWTGPRLTEAGRAVTDPDGRLRQCPTCDLHGEVRERAGELWWDEHVRGCRIEEGRQLASERENLIAAGVDPAALEVPL